MTEQKKFKVEFAPGCFDHWDGTQEELDEFVAEITRMAESGELLEQGEPLSEQQWDMLDPEEQQRLADALSQEQTRRLQ
jgi:hypothetical protein